MTAIKLGSLSIDAREYASSGNAILGIRDSGKSYAATFMAERLMDAGIPIVAFDPIGIWRFLRVAGTGPGYPVVVAGGEHADLPLTPASAPEIMRAAMREGVSLVVDLYSMEMSKADWRRIIESSIKVLLYENKPRGLRHVFVEEAAEVAPQNVRPDQGAVYDVMERLGRMGGNALLGYTLINQRAEQVNKAILELCDSLFLFRQKGKNSLTSLSKWLGVADAKGGKEIIAGLPMLAQGDCWAWVSGSDTPVKVHIPAKRTFHPDRRATHGKTAMPDGKTVNVSAFVEHMQGALAVFVEEAKENDPKRLKARIAELERQVQRGAAAGDGLDMEHVTRMIEEARIRAHAQGWHAACDALNIDSEAFDIFLRQAKDYASRFAEWKAGAPQPLATPQAARSPATWTPRKYPSPEAARRRTNGAALPRGELACLTVIAERKNGATRRQITVITGYKRSTRDAYIQRMREKSYVAEDGDRICATRDGIAALGGNYEPMPSGRALREKVLGELPEGERKVLEILVAAYPQGVDRERISDKTGYARSSRDAYIQRLTSRELVATGSDGVKAVDDLF